MEEIRPAVSLAQQKESMTKKEEEEIKEEEVKTTAGQQQQQQESTKTSSGAGRFNPTEAILATMQLLPLPCAKVMAGRSGQPLPLVFMTAGEIERNVSLVRSYARGGVHQKSENNLAALALRRKSKSQMGLNEEGSPAAAATLSVRTARPVVPLCDQLDELRSFQRQLQNFPSLSELRRHPLVPTSHHQNWLATTSSYSNNRRSLSPATSSRWLTDHGQTQDLPLAIQQQQQSSQSPMSRSTSPSSCDDSRSAAIANGRPQYNTESYALAILQILQVNKI